MFIAQATPAHTRWTWLIALLLAIVLLLAWFFGYWKPNDCCQGNTAAPLAMAPAVVPPPPPMAATPAAPAETAKPAPKGEEQAPVAKAPALGACAPEQLKPVSFPLGSTTLGPRAKQQLLRLAKCLKASGDKIEVAGHTDNTGNAALNQDISTLRAQRVARFLVRAGLGQEQVTAKGYGQSQPVADNSTPAGRLQNRRIEFVKP